MKKIQWRGTWGVGDVCMGLNVAHNYSWSNKDCEVELEFHWNHDEDYKTRPDDPETIIERCAFLHDKYHQNDRVKVSHVFNTSLFHYAEEDPYTDKQKNKLRWIFPNDVRDKTLRGEEMDWVYDKKYYREPQERKTYLGVYWTPQHNSERPRYWKRQLLPKDWEETKHRFIKISNFIELNYQTPIKDVFDIIVECDWIFCYEGMWHYLARNLAKPIVIQSKERVTLANTPQVKRLRNRTSYRNWLISKKPDLLIHGLKNRATTYYQNRLKKFHENR